MYCMSCGAENSDAVKFCKKCGKPINGDNTPTSSGLSSAVSNASDTATTSIGNGNISTADKKNRSELAAFILSICAATLTFVSIPILSWFALPCALIAFLFAYQMWLKANKADVVISNRGLAALVLSAFAIVVYLLSCIPVAGSTDTLSSALGIIDNILSY